MIDSFIKSSLEKNVFGSEADFVAWSAPSNIALAKYWGKKGVQLPQNPSVSFTLSVCQTLSLICYQKKSGISPERIFYFDGKRNDQFGKKAFKLIEFFTADFKILDQLDICVFSANSFPHSSGIASSASAMASLSLCLMEMVNPEEIRQNNSYDSDFFERASHYARLGSGSACRSLFGDVVSWGQLPTVENSSDYFASKIKGIHPTFLSFRDSVLIISSDEKSVSSTVGHNLMNEHPFREVRYKNALKNCKDIIKYMQKGDLSNWGEVVEREALELHGLMMNGPQSFILMKPNTLEVINRVRQFRWQTNIPVYFTLDAGPNIHLLYPNEYLNTVQQFINDELINLLENNLWFDDYVGIGPQNLLRRVNC